jgi:RNA polymerase sigma factor (sigma-70 family)
MDASTHIAGFGLSATPTHDASQAAPEAPRGSRPVRARLDAVARGDEAAFTELYDAWFDFVVHAARGATRRDEAFCLDIAQEVFVTLIHRPPRARTEGELGAWLATTARRRALDHLRAERRRAARELDRPAAPAGEPIEDRRAKLAWLDERLAELADDEADLLIARGRFGWTLDRVGRAFGLTPGAVDGRVARVTRRLRRRAQEGDPDPERDHE